jgi:hypothetical protein
MMLRVSVPRDFLQPPLPPRTLLLERVRPIPQAAAAPEERTVSPRREAEVPLVAGEGKLAALG